MKIELAVAKGPVSFTINYFSLFQPLILSFVFPTSCGQNSPCPLPRHPLYCSSLIFSVCFLPIPFLSTAFVITEYLFMCVMLTFKKLFNVLTYPVPASCALKSFSICAPSSATSDIQYTKPPRRSRVKPAMRSSVMPLSRS